MLITSRMSRAVTVTWHCTFTLQYTYAHHMMHIHLPRQQRLTHAIYTCIWAAHAPTRLSLTPYLWHFLQEAMTKTFEELIELANKFFSSLPPPPSPNSEQADRGSRYDNDSGVVPGSTGSATPDSVSRVEVASTLGRPAQTTVMRPTPTRTVTTSH